MFFALIFFFTAYFLGLSILRILNLKLFEVERAASIVIGLMGLSLILYFAAILFGLTVGLIITVCLMILTGSLIFFKPTRVIRLNLFQLLLRLDHFQKSFQNKTGVRLVQLLKEVKWHQGLVWLFLLILVLWLFGRALFTDLQGNLVAGDRLVWTDWPLHIGMAASFAWGDNFPAQNPTFAGEPLRYPFFADFLTAVLWKLGLPLPTALSLPSIVLILSFFWIFVKISGELLHSDKSLKKLELFNFLPLILSLFWGGLGFVYYFKDLLKSGAFATGNFFPMREYTFWQEKNLWFFTFLYSEILPQRAFIFGLPLFFLVLYLVKSGLENLSNDGKRKIVLGGILTGLMPFFHTYSYLSMVFLALTLAIFGGIEIIRQNKVDRVYKKQYLQTAFLFFSPLGILSLIQLPMFVGQFDGWPFVFGWMKGRENFFIFWFKNTGVFIPLALWGMAKLKKLDKWIVGASWVLFILPNLFQFAPWGYDNLKILTYWYLLGSIGVVVVLGKLWNLKRLRLIGRLTTVLIFMSLTLSGMIEVARIVDTSRNQIRLWSIQDQEIAEEVKQKTPSHAVFLAAAIHDHPVEALAGRKIVIGYPGNSWSWGLKDWDVRFQDVKTMFSGGVSATELWKKYNIDYIIISNRERYMDSEIDEEFIRQNGEVVIDKGSTKVFKLN